MNFNKASINQAVGKSQIKTQVWEPEVMKYNITNDMVDKIELALNKLSVHSRNAQVITLCHNLKTSKDYEEKKKWIILFYVDCFQLLSFIEMAKGDTRSKEDFIFELKKMFQEI